MLNQINQLPNCWLQCSKQHSDRLAPSHSTSLKQRLNLIWEKHPPGWAEIVIVLLHEGEQILQQLLRLELTWIQHVSTADLRLEKVKLHLKNPWTDRGNKLESLTVCYCDHWIIKSDLYNLPGLFSSNLCDSRLRNRQILRGKKKKKRKKGSVQ